ncbi:hypothetical protein [Vibrio parahaemolyticus]|uniref:hypothetical protein n=1 Tax=Vibrio parahaemolyticus TaxID=670 RepID=UPI003892706F
MAKRLTAEKRRGLRNAMERLERAGVDVLACSEHGLFPMISIDRPPWWLISISTPIRERQGSVMIEANVVKMSGCLVRWGERTLCL